jgi:hypothetical protein
MTNRCGVWLKIAGHQWRSIMSTTRLPFPFDPASCEGTNDEALRRRAEIREQNANRPCCVQCESDLVDWACKCVVSAEDEEQQCGGEFIRGDLLCVWCWQVLFHLDEPGGWQWGHA